MSLTHEYIALQENDLREQDLTARLERRRQAAERLVAAHGGERLAAVAALARRSRATRSGTRPATTC
ncbi:MAG: hypothetical protein PGN07_07930 [Aeromicrobium erythreum]